MLKPTADTIAVQTENGIQQHRVYEKKVTSKILITKHQLLTRKKELEEELMQINLDLAQIKEDEKAD